MVCNSSHVPLILFGIPRNRTRARKTRVDRSLKFFKKIKTKKEKKKKLLLGYAEDWFPH
jgi:hypothetical protein